MRAPYPAPVGACRVFCDGCGAAFGDGAWLLQERTRRVLKLASWAPACGLRPGGAPVDLCPGCYDREVADDGTTRLVARSHAARRLAAAGVR